MPTFQAAVMDITVNLLWFISLVLSLAAALFGMIVKRWLREYAMWQTEPPEDGIPLRQMRYQAFTRWKVPLIVALLPGLLEIALIVFMLGIIVMLWNLHALIAFVIPILSSVFLLVAFSVVLMPALFSRCPYRSPAGWACVIAWDALTRCFLYVLWSMGQISRSSYRDHIASHLQTRDWKERDLYLGDMHSSKWHADPIVMKLVYTVDALTWTYERTQDDDVLDCAHLHSMRSSESGMDSSPLRVVIHGICKKFDVDASLLYEAIHRQYIQCNYRDGDSGNKVILSLTNVLPPLNPWQTSGGIIALEIFGRCLLSRAQRFFGDLQMSSQTPVSHSEFILFIDTLCLLYRIVKMSGKTQFRQRYADFLMHIYRESWRCEQEYPEKAIPSFRTVAVQILRQMGSINIAPGTISGNVLSSIHIIWHRT